MESLGFQLFDFDGHFDFDLKSWLYLHFQKKR